MSAHPVTARSTRLLLVLRATPNSSSTPPPLHLLTITPPLSAAVNNQTNEGVAIKKVTNVFSKKILAKRALREIKLLQHFRGHRNVSSAEAQRVPGSSKDAYANMLTNRSHVCMTWTFLDPITSTRRICTRVSNEPRRNNDHKLTQRRADGV